MHFVEMMFTRTIEKGCKDKYGVTSCSKKNHPYFVPGYDFFHIMVFFHVQLIG